MTKNIKIETPNGGYAEVIQHSVSPEGKEIITFSVKYGLIVHSEWIRHRLLSNSVKSNRAVSMKQIRKEVIEDPYVPIKFGGQQAGMVAIDEDQFGYAKVCRWLWKNSRWGAVGVHWLFEKLKLHKEITNRILNPWQWVRSTTTATDYDNFYKLRLHKDAQKDINVIAKAMHEALQLSEPMLINAGEYHVPYVSRRRTGNGELEYYDSDGTQLNTQQAIEASCARCARSSYDNHDGTKASYFNRATAKGRSDQEIYQDLINSDPVHGSCGEHQATPLVVAYKNKKPIYPAGMTHVSVEDGILTTKYWSGNLLGFIQHRQTTKGHVCWDYRVKTE